MPTDENMIAQDLLAILACPRCHGTLAVAATKQRLECATCQLAYAVKDGVPNFLLEDAVKTAATAK